MIDRLREYPILLANLEVSGREINAATADLRLRFLPKAGAVPQPAVIAVRVVQQLGWDPFQPIYFSTTEGSLEATATSLESVQLKGTLQGSYRPVVREVRALIEDGDWLEAPAIPASLDVTLEVFLGGPQPKAPSVSGSLTLRCEALAPVNWVSEVKGAARLFVQDLPATDLSKRSFNYYLPAMPLLVQEHNTIATFNSTGWLLPGGKEVWQTCDIIVDYKATRNFVVDGNISKGLDNGRLGPLLAHIRNSFAGGDAVPIAILQRPVSTSGGMTFDNTAHRAVVMVTENSVNNRTLLAHELGHVLCGKEAGTKGKKVTKDHWVGKDDTVMDGTGTVKKAPPQEVGEFGCENARKFALWK